MCLAYTKGPSKGSKIPRGSCMRKGKKVKSRSSDSRDIRLIGCCGAHCGTCRSFILRSCKGCKLGYDDGSRSIARARCKIKLCCIGVKKKETCAECSEFNVCHLLEPFFSKRNRAYERYRSYLEFIKAKGYPEFVKRAKSWRDSYGKL
jgi:hypothetical protein